jgi:sugar lactone lactonase YvrE
MLNHEASMFASGFVFLEGLRWKNGRIWMSDMWDYACYNLDLDGRHNKICSVPQRPSGFGFLPDGTPVVVSMVDRKLLRIVDNRLTEYADLSAVASGELNDLLIDRTGRAYVGNFGYDLFGGASAGPANIAMISTDGSITVVADNLTFPNGMVTIDNGRTFIVSETFANRLTAYDIDARGGLSNRRVYAELGDRTPDGLCVDREDGVWVASFATGEFIRIAHDGAVTDRVLCEGKRAVGCVLGGEDRRTLFCSTFAGHLDDMVARKRVGAIETVRVSVPGRND